MIERRSREGPRSKRPRAIAICSEMRRQDFQRDTPAQASVIGQIHPAALSEFGDNRVLSDRGVGGKSFAHNNWFIDSMNH